MKQSSRKLVALFLTLAILLSFATVAFAHDNLDECGEEHLEILDEAGHVDMNADEVISPQAACNHNWEQDNSYYVYHAGTYMNASQCLAVLRRTYRCTRCHATVSEDFDLLSPHNVLVDDASCTGSEQTWHMSCYYCGGAEKTEIHACPGAPHIGRPCHWLPA